MTRLLLALAAFFVLTLSAMAQDVTVHEVPIPADIFQSAIDAKLPFTARSGKAIEITFLRGTKVHFKADANIDIEGQFLVTYKERAIYRGEFTATTELTYRVEDNAFYFSRIGLAPNGFHGEILRTSEPKTRLGGWLADKSEAMAEKYLNNRNALRDELEFHLANWIETKPVYKLDGSQFWHKNLAELLNQGKASLLIRKTSWSSANSPVTS